MEVEKRVGEIDGDGKSEWQIDRLIDFKSSSCVLDKTPLSGTSLYYLCNLL